MQEHREKTRKVIEQIIEAEQSYLYTTDTNYLSNNGAFLPVRKYKGRISLIIIIEE